MIGPVAKTSTKAAKKFLKNVQKRDIPAAQRNATNKAAGVVVTNVKRRLAKGAKVQQKYVANRIRKGKYQKKLQGVKTYLIHTHLNPAGTRKYPSVLSSTYRITKTGKKGKGHGQLRAMGRKYDRAFTYSKGWKVPMILQRTGPKAYPLERKTIELGGWAKNSNRNTSHRLFPPKFKKEFDRLLKVKVSKRAR